MQEYYKLHADTLHYFKNEARKAFAGICGNFGLQEENVILKDTDNHFQLTFSNNKVRILVEGVNWGMNTAIHFGLNTKDSDLYSILQLIKERKPELVVDGNQIDQLYVYAHYLMTDGSDILTGDTTFFYQQEVWRKQEKEKAWKAEQAESTRKIAEGHQKIDIPFGESVWRKFRPQLSTYSITKEKFPHSLEVVFTEDDSMTYSQSEAIISNWRIELDEIVMKDKVICEVNTDKVSVEIVAPQTGRLIWLLEEGVAFKFPTCIALLDPNIL
jgi:hypothetical protein